ncbi:hypothetical protein DRQ16_01695 [bacterium]|nr:MAG: hypothetical protein DRQ16_01695 [bacterium]
MRDYIELIRPFNAIFAGVCTMLGAVLAGDLNVLSIIAALVVFLIAGGGNAFNDYMDREVDKKLGKKRPIPSGKIKPENALYFSIALFACGNLVAFFMGKPYFIFALVVTVLLILYSLFLKKILIVSNVTVALLGSLVFPFGAMTAGNVRLSTFPFIFAFLLHLPREILKDGLDIEGDKIRGIRSIPQVIGFPKTSLVVKFILLLLLLLTPLPYRLYGREYLFAVLFLVDLPILYLSIALFPTEKSFSQAEKLLKFMMVGGFISLLLGGI